MIAPCLAMLAANSIFPLLYAVTVAFQNYQILIPVPHRFVGFRNFEKAFSDPLFWSSLSVTAWFIAGVVLLQFPVGFGLAVLLNRLRRHQDLLATLLLVPTIISTSVAGFQWVQLFNYQFGPINYLLGLLHLPQPTWTADPALALPCLIFVDFWQWTPFMTLLMFAGLRSLPGTIVDAARVDGSTGWQIVWRIYLPLLEAGDRHRRHPAHPDGLQAFRHHLRAHRGRARNRYREPGLLHLCPGLSLLRLGLCSGAFAAPARLR